jgi:pimeloyl-ACP methyl ester carboxylesterase
MRTLAVRTDDGFPLAVQTSGPDDGPPLLLLQGQANSHTWWNRVPRLLRGPLPHQHLRLPRYRWQPRSRRRPRRAPGTRRPEPRTPPPGPARLVLHTRLAAWTRAEHPSGRPSMTAAESAAHLRASARHDAWTALPGIHVPTLVLHGSDDLHGARRQRQRPHLANPGCRGAHASRRTSRLLRAVRRHHRAHGSHVPPGTLTCRGEGGPEPPVSVSRNGAGGQCVCRAWGRWSSSPAGGAA